MRFFLEVVAVHEHVFSSGVSMEITIENALALLRELSNQLFDIENDWMHLFIGIFVPTIKVLTTQTAPIVSIDDTIHIDHR